MFLDEYIYMVLGVNNLKIYFGVEKEYMSGAGGGRRMIALYMLALSKTRFLFFVLTIVTRGKESRPPPCICSRVHCP